ncbi:MAG TPA: hypothetical protein VFT91_08525, partial [Dehalococcoidia bacterium]|nr:hypothetical protein [Dehalococcoidia bacterium]
MTVTPVAGRDDLDAFIRLPWRLYRGDHNWVPPLLRLQRELFSPQHDPFYQHADVQLFLARRDGQVVGRVSAQVDHEHNRYHGERTGFFGFFECEDDPTVAAALFGTAESWLLERGMDRVRGPLSFSINGEVGLLVQGFDSPPMMLMPYSKPYYQRLIEASGYAKAQDLFAWRYDWTYIPVRAQRIVQQLRRSPEVKLRVADLRRLDQEVHTILDIYNDAWSDNWGFVPATEAEAKKMADDIRLIVDPEIVPFVEVDGRPAGVALALPNLNEAIRDLDGRLFPLGLLKLLWRLKVRRLKTGRLLLLGIKKEFRTRRYAGLAYLLCDEIHRRGKARGYDWAEFSWTLESNVLINRMIEHIECAHY